MKKRAVKAKRGRGRPPHAPTEESKAAVQTMVGVGLALADICVILKINGRTLSRHYKDELAGGRAWLVARMRTALILKADAGDILALLHINKVLGWNERLIVVDGGSEVDPTTLSEPELLRRIAELKRMPAVTRAGRAATSKAPGTLH